MYRRMIELPRFLTRPADDVQELLREHAKSSVSRHVRYSNLEMLQTYFPHDVVRSVRVAARRAIVAIQRNKPPRWGGLSVMCVPDGVGSVSVVGADGALSMEGPYRPGLQLNSGYSRLTGWGADVAIPPSESRTSTK